MNAYKELSPSAFAFYLYLAGNADGFLLELSMEATKNALGFSKATYDRAVSMLKEKNYLNQISGNKYEFTLTPCDDYHYQNWETQNCGKSEMSHSTSELRNEHINSEEKVNQFCGNTDSELNREIDNIDNIDTKEKIDNQYDVFDHAVIQDYTEKMNLGGLYSYLDFIDDMSDKYVQIDFGTMMKKSLFEVTEMELSQIKNAIILIVDRFGELDTRTFKAFQMFLRIKEKWNKYLLVGIIKSYFDEEFIIENTSNMYSTILFIF